VLLLAAVACGDDDNSDDGGGNTGDGDNTGNSTGNNTGDDGGENTGNSTGNNTGERGDPVTDAENCADDVATTPGIDCKGYVACGGDVASPHACPTATHSCCAAGFPSEETVNCYEGKNACTADETITPCDGPDDCSDGEVCCVNIGASASTECTPSADCAGFSLCHTADDCDPGESCKAFSMAAFWSFCG
jgi:hypothetical protein